MTARPQATPAHTPGPWEVVYAEGDPELRVARPDRALHAPDGMFIGMWKPAATTRRQRDLIEGNARLIAQAPALLAALEWFADEFDGIENDPEWREDYSPDEALRIIETHYKAARAAIAAARGQS